ncbi:hypothetical protein ZIOFF_056049 [Zingiber officinale]|uniref:dUTPase-like domain-containing protein n=1 Tax=Zingiber officinale TaxID=94328 RepID=A0A8J5FLI4_ZINOF|nr:hypothetical protein ZIOFF_056049 [Zingiber officinale]
MGKSLSILYSGLKYLMDIMADLPHTLDKHGKAALKSVRESLIRTTGQKIAQLILERIALPEINEVPHLSITKRGEQGFGSSDISDQPIPSNQPSSSQQPQYFTPTYIFSLLMPHETTVVLLQGDSSFLNNSEKDHAATTSPWTSVPQSMDPTPNYEDHEESYLDYIHYLSTLSNPQNWNDSLDDDWTNPFANEGGGMNLLQQIVKWGIHA